jgi:predicted DNA-binding ribbon-helix-helix protein
MRRFVNADPSTDPLRLVSTKPEDARLEFRAVAFGAKRRGIRLERIFWNVLKELARAKNSPMGALVEDLSKDAGEINNLASIIRVACLNWLHTQNAELVQLASLQTANSIIMACPAPAFALSSAKKILTFNPPFQLLVRRQLPTLLNDDSRRELKLTLDLNIADIFERLKTNGETPVTTGFALGAGERRYRGQLNAIIAPAKDLEMLLAFVL